MIRLSVGLYFLGLFYMYTHYILDIPYPDDYYYLWEKICSGGVLVWFVVYKTTIKDKFFAEWALIVTLVRVVWQSISVFAYNKYHVGIQAGDDWRVATCFLTMLIAVGVICLWRKNRFERSLEKYTP